MSFELAPRDTLRLQGVHPDLIRVVRGAALHYPATGRFIVVEGLRTLEKQREYFQAGKSRTMKSRHLTGHAVDLAPYVDTDGDGDLELSWDRNHFLPIVDAMRASAAAGGIPIVWGGDWTSFQDCPHFELDRSRYP